MLKVIRQKIIDDFERHISLADLGFERQNRIKGMSTREYTIFKRILENGATLFLTFYIKAGRDHVTPSIQWSKDGTFPVDEEAYVLLKKGDRKNDDSGWLHGSQFGEHHSYELSNDTPSEERITEIAQKKSNIEILSSLGMDDLPDDDWWHDWEMIEELFPEEVITTDDVEYAIGSVIKDVTNLIDECFLPFFETLKITKH